MDIALLSSAYFAPVQWYQKLNRYDVCVVEQHDHFVKQTYRNRCLIATANGLQALTVPVERDGGGKCLMRDVRISNHGNWRHLHWQALQSAYGESPFFEFYADDIRPFFDKKWAFLFDYNMEIAAKMCELADLQPTIRTTEAYVAAADKQAIGGTCVWNGLPVDDYRDLIRPKNAPMDSTFEQKEYYQVYHERHGFLPNLSILDLLFNCGAETILYL